MLFAALGFYQEYRAEQAIAALRRMAVASARIARAPGSAPLLFRNCVNVSARYWVGVLKLEALVVEVVDDEAGEVARARSDRTCGIPGAASVIGGHLGAGHSQRGRDLRTGGGGTDAQHHRRRPLA